MNEKLLNELIEDTSVDDIAERYRGVVDIIGIRNFIQLSDYSRGMSYIFRRLKM